MKIYSPNIVGTTEVDASGSYSIGSTDYPFASGCFDDVFIKGSTLHIGSDATISSPSGILTFNDAQSGSKTLSDLLSAGSSSLPYGTIVMWYGSVASIPTGWALCNGSNGTPDLRDKFVIGAKQDDSGTAKTNVTGSLTQTGGEATHTLTTDEMPSHDHSDYDTFIYGSDPNSRKHWPNGWQSANNPVTDTSNSYTSQVGYDIPSDGGGKSHNNLPPYYALCYIMKT